MEVEAGNQDGDIEAARQADLGSRQPLRNNISLKKLQKKISNLESSHNKQNSAAIKAARESDFD